jgi:Helix-turn-helix domain
MVQEGGRHAAIDVWAIGEAALWSVSLVCEREEIALLRAPGYSMQEVVLRLGRAASTISRELRRNAATRSGGLEYRATTGQRHAERAAHRPKQAKLAVRGSASPWAVHL